MASNKTTIGLAVGIVIAIIMSGAALAMLVTVNDKLSSITAHEENENSRFQ